MNIEKILKTHCTKTLLDCIWKLEIIAGKPSDWRLCKQELYDQFDDATITIGRKVIKSENYWYIIKNLRSV